MFSNHINQTVHLAKPEFPRVFTGFENQVGKYSIAYKRAKKDFTIIGKVRKNPCVYTLVIQYRNGTYDCIDVGTAVNICEEYGYKINDCLKDKDVGDYVCEGDYIYKSDNYDDDGNFAYGTNLRALYNSHHNLTYEDGCVISRSAAEKLKSYKVEKTLISVNTNDILLNLYSDLNTSEYDGYHSIPKVGEHTKGNILVASRREEAQNVLYNFQQQRMKEIDTSDQIYYTCGGTIADINVYSNTKLADLKNRAFGVEREGKKTGPNEFAMEVYNLYSQQYEYYKELAELLETIIPAYTEEEYVATLSPEEKQAYYQERKEYGFYYKRHAPKEQNPNKYTDELDYKWKIAHEYIDERIAWRNDGKRFDNVMIEFTILKVNPVTVGCKLSGRYGNKGVVACIKPDEEMPVTQEGVRAEILLNPLGVINRINPAQLLEQYITFISDRVLEQIKSCSNVADMEEIYLDFMKRINPNQYEFIDLEFMSMNRAQKQAFFDDLIRDGIYIHEPPFVGNTSIEDLVEIFKDHPEWTEKYHFVNMERPEIMGEEYFIRLKHEASNKSSVRAKGMLSIKNMPSKSALKKDKKALYNDNPLRLGEMETNALLVAKRPDLVAKLLRTYSSNMEDRQNLVEQLVTAKDPMNVDAKLCDDKPITRQILDNYLKVLELQLEDD